MGRRIAVAVLGVALVAGACSSADDQAVITSEEASADDGGGSPSATVARADGSSGDSGAELRPSSPVEATDAAASGEEFERADGGDFDVAPEQQLSLSAGWVDDNEQFDDYVDFLDRSAISGVSLIDVTARQVIRVLDDAGSPVAGALVRLESDGVVVHEARTAADGRVLAFPAAVAGEAEGQQQPRAFTAVVEYGGEVTRFELDAAAADHQLTLDETRQPTTALDLLFVIDATGSMSDEIERLKANMGTVADQIATDQQQIDLRYGMVTYRDHGDTFVTRTTDFTPDLAEFQAELDEVAADGGGDIPEAVDEALHEAVDGVSWRVGEAVGLVFWVADAPPHLDDPQNRFDYAESALAANQMGLKIFPVASSGLDPAGEYVFRQVAQLTGAPFVFLTYGADGGPGTERPEFDVEDYSVLALDQLIVRLVNEEIDHQLTA